MDISNELLCRILGGESLSKVTVLNWHITDDVAKLGNNHTSELSRLTVEFQRKGRIFKKSFVLKIPSAHPMYSIGLRYKIYDKEYPIYTVILEEMYKIDGEHIGPRLYYTDNKHSLILKDLSQSGYKIVDRTKQLDYDHCSVALKSLAKFHALSVKLNQMSRITKFIKQILWMADITHECKEETDEWMRNACDQLAKHIDPKFGLSEKILRLKDTIFERIVSSISSEKFSFNVLNHGDCWMGNAMFKFDKYGMVKKAKFIDFQTSFWTSPAFDILVFTLTSMRFEVFERHFDFLMETYIDSLNKVLRYLQCGSYAMEDLRRDMNSMRTFIVILLGDRLAESLCRHENPINYRRVVKDGRIDYSQWNKMYENEMYVEVLNKWISYYADKGVFD